MSEYHLQARRAVRGSCPRREQTRLVDVDSLDEALAAADEFAVDGFTSWVFRRSARTSPTATTDPLHLITTVAPTHTSAAGGRDAFRTANRRTLSAGD